MNVFYKSDQFSGELSPISYMNTSITDSLRNLKMNNSEKGEEKPGVIPVVRYELSLSGENSIMEGDVNRQGSPFIRPSLDACNNKKEAYLRIMYCYDDNKIHFNNTIIEFSDMAVTKKKYRYLVLHIA